MTKGPGDQAKECELHLERKAQPHENFKLARGVSQFTTWRLRGSSPEKSGRWDGAGRQSPHATAETGSGERSSDTATVRGADSGTS